MLKFFFWILVLANAALFAYQQGAFDGLLPNGHEPARLANQLNADKLRLVPPPQPGQEPVPEAPPAPDLSAPVAEQKPATVACIEIGNFGPGEAQRFAQQLAALALGERVTQKQVTEVATHMVYIPPQGDKEGAERKAGELRNLGIEDFFIIQDNSSMRWGISLGVFKHEEAARAHLANLNRKGVRTARIGQRGVTANLVAFQLRDLDEDTRAAVEKIKENFARQEIRSCTPV